MILARTRLRPIQTEVNIVTVSVAQQELIDLLQGELAETLGSNSEASTKLDSNEALQSWLEEQRLSAENISNAAELVGLNGLSKSCQCLIRNFDILEGIPSSFPKNQLQILKSWPVFLMGYLQYFGDSRQESAVKELTNFLADPVWPLPLDRYAVEEITEACRASSVNLQESLESVLPRHATEEMADLSATDDLDPELVQSLLLELPEQVDGFESAVEEYLLTQKPEHLLIAQRIAHTLKGSANVVGIKGIANLMHFVEDLLEHSEKGAIDGHVGYLLLDASDCLASAAEYIAGNGPKPSNLLSVMQSILEIIAAIEEGEKEGQGDDRAHAQGIINSSFAAQSELTSEDKNDREASTSENHLDEDDISLKQEKLAAQLAVLEEGLVFDGRADQHPREVRFAPKDMPESNDSIAAESKIKPSNLETNSSKKATFTQEPQSNDCEPTLKDKEVNPGANKTDVKDLLKSVLPFSIEDKIKPIRQFIEDDSQRKDELFDPLFDEAILHSVTKPEEDTKIPILNSIADIPPQPSKEKGDASNKFVNLIAHENEVREKTLKQLSALRNVNNKTPDAHSVNADNIKPFLKPQERSQPEPIDDLAKKTGALHQQITNKTITQSGKKREAEASRATSTQSSKNAPLQNNVKADEGKKSIKAPGAVNKTSPVQEVKVDSAAEDADFAFTITETQAQELLRLVGEMQIGNTQILGRVSSVSMGLKSALDYHQKLRSLSTNLERIAEMRGELTGLGESSTMGYSTEDSLELERYNEIHSFANELNEVVTDAYESLTHTLNDLRELKGIVQENRQLGFESQDMLVNIRMVPVKLFEQRFNRCVRQASRLTGKAVMFRLEGGQVMVDSRVMNELMDPIMHLLRNAVDHGIESKSQLREELGKPSAGQVCLKFSRHGDNITVVCEDDGRGIDFTQVQQTAKLKGLIDSDAILSEEELKQIILTAGFSTRRSVSQTSGRGFGLDIVNEQVKRLKGHMDINSQRGKGISVVVRAPMSMLSAHTLLVKMGAHQLSLLSRGIDQIIYVEKDKLELKAGKRFYKMGDGELLPLFHIEDLLTMPVFPNKHKFSALLVIKNKLGQRCGVLVEAIIASEEQIIKPLPHYAFKVQGCMGACILEDGSVSPVIDLHELPELEMSDVSYAKWRERFDKRMKQLRQSTSVQRPLALVVDDSLSARRSLAQFIGDAGMEVITAKDGLEAIQQINKKPPDIILVDLEMPRMNGLELTSHVRASETNSNIPIVMITSRATEKHRHMAAKAGVTSYLNKPWSEDELMKKLQSFLTLV